MSISAIENVIGAQLASITAVVPEGVGRFVAHPRESLEKMAPEKANVVKPTIAISAVCLGALVLGALRRRPSVRERLDAMTDRLPFVSTRRRKAKRALDAIGGIGIALASSVMVALVQGVIGKKVSKIGESKAARGAGAAAVMMALDGALSRGGEALGLAAKAAKYAAIGTAYALTSKPEKKPDPSGGDIAAGVPAM